MCGVVCVLPLAVCIYICMHHSVHVCVGVLVCVNDYICAYMCLCTCVYIYMCVCVRGCVYACACTCVEVSSGKILTLAEV